MIIMASAQPNASVARGGLARVAIGCVLIRRQITGAAVQGPLPLLIIPGPGPEALWEATLLPRGRAFQRKSPDSGHALIETPREIRESGSSTLHIV